MIRLAKLSIEEVLPFTGKGQPRKVFKVNGRLFNVRMNSLRFDTFRKSIYCMSCGIEGSFFLLEQPNPKEGAHLNLYHRGKNRLILMTKDHIIPVSKGGPNEIDNLQTMCSRCNLIKSNNMPDNIMLTQVPLKLLGVMFYLCAI